MCQTLANRSNPRTRLRIIQRPRPAWAMARTSNQSGKIDEKMSRPRTGMVQKEPETAQKPNAEHNRSSTSSVARGQAQSLVFSIDLIFSSGRIYLSLIALAMFHKNETTQDGPGLFRHVV